MSVQLTRPSYIDLAAKIVAAYVSKNSVPQAELPALIHSVYTALNKTAEGATGPRKRTQPRCPD